MNLRNVSLFSPYRIEHGSGKIDITYLVKKISTKSGITYSCMEIYAYKDIFDAIEAETITKEPFKSPPDDVIFNVSNGWDRDRTEMFLGLARKIHRGEEVGEDEEIERLFRR